MPTSNTDVLGALTVEVIAFRDDRDWKQFHNPKDVAVSMALEAAEYLELFQWKSPEDAARVSRERASEELADVFYWVLLAAHDLEIDLPSALRAKIRINGVKYPTSKARGNAAKYTEL